MADDLSIGKTYRIIDIDIAKSVEDRVSVPMVIGLVAGLYNNHATMKNPVMTFMPRHLGYMPDSIAIIGVFDSDDQIAKTCICRFDELVEGAPSGFGPQLLYPHAIEIAYTVNFPTVIERFFESLSAD